MNMMSMKLVSFMVLLQLNLSFASASAAAAANKISKHNLRGYHHHQQQEYQQHPLPHHHRELNLLERRWEVSVVDHHQKEASLSSVEMFSVDIGYRMSDYIQDHFVQVRLYDSMDCYEGTKPDDNGVISSVDITDDTSLHVVRSNDHTPRGSGSQMRRMNLTIAVLDDALQQLSMIAHKSSAATDVTTNEEDSTSSSSLAFCIRFSLYNKNASMPDAVEVNYDQSIVLLDLTTTNTSSSSTTTTTTPQIHHVHDMAVLSNEKLLADPVPSPLGVEIYECDSSNQKIGLSSLYVQDERAKKKQASTLRYCLTPTPEAMDVGMRLHGLDDFFFSRNVTTITTTTTTTTTNGPDIKEEHHHHQHVTQIAVQNGVHSNNELSHLECEDDGSLCVLQSVLVPHLFSGGDGTVMAYGTALLQFFDTNYENPIWEGRAPVSLYFPVQGAPGQHSYMPPSDNNTTPDVVITDLDHPESVQEDNTGMINDDVTPPDSSAQGDDDNTASSASPPDPELDTNNQEEDEDPNAASSVLSALIFSGATTPLAILPFLFKSGDDKKKGGCLAPCVVFIWLVVNLMAWVYAS